MLTSISVFFHTIPNFSYKIVGFLEQKEYARNLPWWKVAFFMHISVGVLILLSGISQFSKRLREGYLQIHRTLGKIYVFAVLCLSAPGGFVMALYSRGELPSQIAFTLLAVLWFYFTLRAYQFIRAKNIREHENFMLRSYALTFAAVTLRVYLAIAAMAFGTRSDFSYILISYLAWIPNWLIIEWYIRRRG